MGDYEEDRKDWREECRREEKEEGREMECLERERRERENEYRKEERVRSRWIARHLQERRPETSDCGDGRREEKSREEYLEEFRT